MLGAESQTHPSLTLRKDRGPRAQLEGCQSKQGSPGGLPGKGGSLEATVAHGLGAGINGQGPPHHCHHQHLALAGDSRAAGLSQVSGLARIPSHLALCSQGFKHILVRGICEARKMLGGHYITLYSLFSKGYILSSLKRSILVPLCARFQAGLPPPIQAQLSSQSLWDLKQVPSFHGSQSPQLYNGDKT